jgi:hypothetical protein
MVKWQCLDAALFYVHLVNGIPLKWRLNMEVVPGAISTSKIITFVKRRVLVLIRSVADF